MRGVVDTAAARDPRARQSAMLASTSAVRAEAPPGAIRIVVRQPAFLEAVRHEHPDAARFRFEPCPATDATAGCGDHPVTITWQ
jgi:hypothetical protein